MRVLVTGASGFLGRVVVRRLEMAGHHVVAMVRCADVKVSGAADHVVGDVCRPDTLAEAVRDVGGVCHLAALTRARESIGDPVRYWQVNAIGTVNLLAALCAGAATPRRLVLASTCAVYDLGDGAEAVSESVVERPMTPYGTSKLAADRAAADVARAGLLGAISVRALNIGGASDGRGDGDDTRLIPQVVATARDESRRLRINGDGSARRDFLHVEDAADAFVLALEACESGVWRAYNIGSGSPSSVRDVITEAGRILGRELPVDFGPAQSEPLIIAADSSRIRDELSWTPTRSTLSQVLTDALDADRYS